MNKQLEVHAVAEGHLEDWPRFQPLAPPPCNWEKIIDTSGGFEISARSSTSMTSSIPTRFQKKSNGMSSMIYFVHL